MAKKQVKKTVAKKQKNEKVKEKKIDKKEPKVVEKIKTEKTISSSGETIIKKDISSEIISRMMPYALSVIESRALPFIEDGFKPSQRFWLYGMKMSGADGERTIKSGEIEGVVMGKLNPHAGAYLTGVRLTDGAESLLTPYIYGEGNFGKHYSENIKEAAARYTEMKLNKLGKEIVLGSIKYHPSNIESNFNGCYQQPKFLGAAFPNILANPQQGIAVGYACQWGSFNLKELCEATKYIIKNKAKTDKDLVNKVLEIMPTMDFSSGGETDLNKEELTNIYLNGEGKIVLRARFENNQKERVLEIFEIPYVTNAENIANAIIKAVDSGKITEVSDVRNETGLNKKTGEATLKIAIDYKSGTDVEELKKKLFALTSCQANLNVNMFGLYNNIPAKYGVINCIKKWIEFRENWLKEEFTEILKELKDRLHLLEGLEKILVDIDKAVKIVKNSKTDEEVITGLMKGFKLDEVQAEFVANIKLRNFNKDYILNKIKEIKDLKNQIKDYENKLKDINSEMINQLDETIKNYGIDRKTIISKEKWEELPVITTRTKEPEKLDGDSMVFTGSDWAKRVPSDSGAKAPNGSEKVVTPNNGELLIFCNTAKVFKWTIGKLKNNTQTKITDIKKIAKKLEGGDQILYVTPLIEKRKIVIFFDNGKAAKIPESAWSTESSKLLFKKGRYDKANILHIEAIDKDKIIEIAGKKYDTSKIKEVGNKTGQGAKVKPEK